MSKDPAINWYFDNWAGGTKTMSRFLKGCYIDLLDAQFHLGHLSLEEIKQVLGSDFSAWKMLEKKFKKDESENFFNERMELEVKKRKLYSVSRSNNRKKTYENHMNDISKTSDVVLYKTENGIGTEVENGISEKIKNEWISVCEKDLRKRMLSNSVADLVSKWLNEMGIKSKREVSVGEHCRIDIGVYEAEELACIIEAKNYREKNEYYKPLKQIAKYSQFGIPIVFLPSIRQAFDIILSVKNFIDTAQFDNSFVFIPLEEKIDLFFELSPLETSNTSEYVERTIQKKIIPTELNNLFSAFAIQYKNDYYPNRNKVIQHFRDWLKKQKNGNTVDQKSNRSNRDKQEAATASMLAKLRAATGAD
jgi:hypothetical protein